MIKLIIFTTMISGEPQMIEGALFNEHDYEYAIEARRRGKGQKGRRRGGSGLR